MTNPHIPTTQFPQLLIHDESHFICNPTSLFATH